MSKNFKTINFQPSHLQIYLISHLNFLSQCNCIIIWEDRQCEFFWLNILTHKSKWVVNHFHNLFFMNERLNILSSSTNPNIWTIPIFTNFTYSLSLQLKIIENPIFIDNLEIRFKSKCATITPFVLWDIVTFKKLVNELI